MHHKPDSRGAIREEFNRQWHPRTRARSIHRGSAFWRDKLALLESIAGEIKRLMATVGNWGPAGLASVGDLNSVRLSVQRAYFLCYDEIINTQRTLRKWEQLEAEEAEKAAKVEGET